MQSKLFIIVLMGLMSVQSNCSTKSKSNTTTPTNPPEVANEVDFWLTTGDQSVLLQKQSSILAFGTTTNSNLEISVDTTQRFQTIDGFGYTLSQQFGWRHDDRLTVVFCGAYGRKRSDDSLA